MDHQVFIANKALHLESHHLDCEFQNVIDHAVDSIDLPAVSEEIKLLLKFYVTTCLLKNGQTIGSIIYKLKFTNEDLTKPKHHNVVLFNVFNLLTPYLFRRREIIKTQLQRVLGKHETSWLQSDYSTLMVKAMSVVNFLIFLFQGKYLTLAARISRLVPVISDQDYGASMAINRVQMELLDREIIWRELAIFLTTVIPYIRMEKLRYKLTQVLYSFGMGSAIKCESKIMSKDVNQMDLHRCGICESQPFNPYSIGCRHVFCYYCLESRHLLDSKAGYSCAKCNYVTKDISDVHRHKVYAALDL